ncbi:hypothetical protein MKW92_043856, partial [Papaver armeniacum]
MVFIIGPQPEFLGAKASNLPGLFGSKNIAQPTHFVLAIEIDTIHNRDYDSILGDHVGIDLNNFTSVISQPSGYYTDNNGGFHNLSLISGDPIQVWIEYDGDSKNLNVTLAPLTVPKPDTPLFSYNHDLSDFLSDSMYVGFSAATSFAKLSHYILGWSFMINNGTALPINLSQLPELPTKQQNNKRAKFLGVDLPIIIPILVLTFTVGILILCVLGKIWNCKLADVVEDWELNYERLRVSYKDLYIATNGFKEKQLLGRPTELHKSESEEGEILADWVLNCWRRGEILQTSDPNLGNEYIKEEMELVLKLGLLCSDNDAKARPNMRQ